MARECAGCIHNLVVGVVDACMNLKHPRLYHGTSIVAREHDPGRCYEDRRKDEPQEEQP